MADIVIEIGEDSFEGVIDEEAAPRTARRLLDALPIEATANTWGEEIYFTIPVDAPPENAVETVAVGQLAYWPRGSAMCIFFGKTPMSESEEEIVPASPVNPLGTVENPEGFKRHGSGETVRVRRR